MTTQPTIIERAMGEPRCSFCKRSRLQVGTLMTNEDGTTGICNDCFVEVARGFSGLPRGSVKNLVPA